MTVYANPGAIADVAATGTVESTWMNAIRDRTIANFSSTAARDTAIPSPVVGQLCTIGTTLTLLQYVGATDGWTAPWNLAWGELAYAEVTANTGTITTLADITGLTALSVTVKANRLVYVEFWCGFVDNSGGQTAVFITTTGNTKEHANTHGTTSSGPMQIRAKYLTTAGTFAKKIRASDTGLGTIFHAGTGDPGRMYYRFVDEGPGGAPA